VKIFKRDLNCFLRVPHRKILHCSASGDVSFVLHTVEKGEGKDGNGCCTLNVHESVCRGVLVLVMGLSSRFGSYDEA